LGISLASAPKVKLYELSAVNPGFQSCVALGVIKRVITVRVAAGMLPAATGDAIK
jgi:hypothetical protein